MKKIDYSTMFTLRSDGRYMGYYKDADGNRHALYDRDPKALYAKIREKEKPAPITYQNVAESWSNERFEVLAYKSVEAYKPCLKRIVERFGSCSLDEIETIDINAFLSWLASRQYSKRTVQMHRDIMSQIFNWAIAHQLTRYNPCDHASMPKGLSQGTRGIPSDEAIEAVKCCKDHPFALFASICLYAGLRRGEALALQYEDIDRRAKCIHVTKSVEYQANKPNIKSPKTENSKRDAILLDVLADMIPNGTGYIFTNESGQIITRDRFNDRWKSYCKHIGFNITPHQLRHGFATILYEAGVPDKDAQELLGHSDITLTRNVYTHIRSAQKAKIAEQLNSFVVNDVVKSPKTIDIA